MEENKTQPLEQENAQLPISSEDDLSLILEDLPKEKRIAIERVIQLRVIQRVSSFSGPIPHPEHFAKYEEVLSGAADRILAMAEKEQEVRHELEKKEAKLKGRGMWLGPLLVFILIGAFTYISIDLQDGQILKWLGAIATIILVVLVLRSKPWK